MRYLKNFDCLTRRRSFGRCIFYVTKILLTSIFPPSHYLKFKLFRKKFVNIKLRSTKTLNFFPTTKKIGHFEKEKYVMPIFLFFVMTIVGFRYWQSDLQLIHKESVHKKITNLILYINVIYLKSFADLKSNLALFYNKGHNFRKSLLTWKIPPKWKISY